MEFLIFTAVVYVSLTGVCGFSLWLWLGTRRELRKMRREEVQGGKSVPALRAEILRLREEGLDRAAIARELGIPSGEVSLVLDLAAAQRTTVLATA